MHCQDAAEIIWKPKSGGPVRLTPEQMRAVSELSMADHYERHAADCKRQDMRLISHRLNLLPPASAVNAGSFYQSLFAPLGRDGVVVFHLGLWVGALARHKSFAKHGTMKSRHEAAASYFKQSVRALFELACSRQDWPRLVWQLSLPQHFATVMGEYDESQIANQQTGCRPMSKIAAQALWEHRILPVINAADEVHGKTYGEAGGCRQRLRLLRGFWPLVERYEDHPGRVIGRTRKGMKRNGSAGFRYDCTHWLPCSSAMNLQLRLLIGALAA